MTRLLLLNRPAESEPPKVSVDAAPGVELVKVTMPLAEPPGGMSPNGCGNGVPLVAPNLAVVNCTFVAVVLFRYSERYS